MKTILLSGFLGAGKTTVLLQLARFLAGDKPRPNQVAILENEIGQVGIDDQMLRGSGLQVSELFAGCACCTSSGELRGTVRVIRKELNPQWLIVEATGLAYPLRIKETLDPILPSPAVICTLVDAQRLNRMLRAVEPLVDGQLQDADLVLVNKVDLVERQTLEQVHDIVSRYSPRGAVYDICALQPVAPHIWDHLTALCR